MKSTSFGPNNRYSKSDNSDNTWLPISLTLNSLSVTQVPNPHRGLMDSEQLRRQAHRQMSYEQTDFVTVGTILPRNDHLPKVQEAVSRYIYLEYTSYGHFTVNPIFHWILGLRLPPNANEISTKNMKCTWPTWKFCVWNPTQPIFHWLVLGFCVRWRKFLAFLDTNMLVFPMQNSRVGGVTQRQTPMRRVLRRSGNGFMISALKDN